jgi:hypothetical protein
MWLYVSAGLTGGSILGLFFFIIIIVNPQLTIRLKFNALNVDQYAPNTW